MIYILDRPHASYLIMRHETDGAIAPDGSLVSPVITECCLKIPHRCLEAAELIVEEIRKHLDDCGALEDEEYEDSSD